MSRENNLFRSLASPLNQSPKKSSASIFSPEASLGIKSMAEKGISDNKQAIYAQSNMYRNLRTLECFLKS